MSAAANWIEQAISTGGTGNLVLGSSVNEGVTFTQAFGADQTDILYSIQSAADEKHIECGLCDYTDATGTITNRRPEATFDGSTYDNTSPSVVDVPIGAIISTPLTYQAYVDLLATTGVTVYIQGTAPTTADDGDFWIDNS